MHYCNVMWMPGHYGEKQFWVPIVMRVESDNLTNLPAALRNNVNGVKVRVAWERTSLEAKRVDARSTDLRCRPQKRRWLPKSDLRSVQAFRNWPCRLAVASWLYAKGNLTQLRVVGRIGA
jgi:hypothetical protein